MNTEKIIKGSIFDIERFAVHDGPGIRTVIFLKGCSLKCLWCANPEGQSIRPQLVFIRDKCINCKRCVLVCPQRAIKILNNNIIQDWSKCEDCLKCIEVCPVAARQQKGYNCSVKEVMNEVVKDIPFYRRSGGGVTLSGGDPIAQVDFSRGILKLCKDQNIHTAIETSGYTNWINFLKIIKYTDLIYIDIKHMSPVKHKLFTGVSNTKILANIEKISKLEKSFIIRIPVIPGYNDSDNNIIETCRFAKSLNNLMGIELLPYHKLGKCKYEYLGMDYLLGNVNIPSNKKMKYITKLVKSQGIKCIINN